MSLSNNNRDGEVIVQFLKGLIRKAEKTRDKNSIHVLKGLQTIMIANDLWAAHLTSINTFRYIDIDSTYRNRNLYPLSSNFVIPYTNMGMGTNITNSIDPVCESLPYVISYSGYFSTDSLIVPNDNILIVNYYRGYLEINGYIRKIVSYIPNTGIYITPPLPATPDNETIFYVRKKYPYAIGMTSVGSTYNSVILNSPVATFSTVDNFYKGMVIRFSSGNLDNVVRTIIAYDGATSTAYLDTPLDEIPALVYFDLNTFSYDNGQPMRYNGSRTLQNEQCYTIQLCQLSIPNQVLDNPPINGYPYSYPYLYVHLYNDPRITSHTMYSNNPNAALAVFKVAINIIVSNISSNGIPFLVFDNVNLALPTSIKFCPWHNMRFRVTLPNGVDLKFGFNNDNKPPFPPNPMTQISALFAINLKTAPPTTDNIL